MAIRGWLRFQPEAVSTQNGAFFAAIWLLDIDEAAPTPSNVVNYQDDDSLWSGGSSCVAGSGVISPWNAPTSYELNIKARRKLVTDSVISLTMSTVSSDATFQACGLIRALVQLP